MGNVARIGISDGRKVPVDGLLTADQPAAIDSFSRGGLERYGFLEIAEKLSEGEPLLLEEIEALLAEAPIPVLIKLVQLVPDDGECIGPRPILYLPLAEQIGRLGEEAGVAALCAHLIQIPYHEFGVVFDSVDLFDLSGRAGEILRQIADCRTGMDFYAPDLDRVIGVLGKNSAQNPFESDRHLERVLNELRELGFHAFKRCHDRRLARMLYKAGFPVALRTNLDHFPSPREFALELTRIDVDSRGEMAIQAWYPGVSSVKLKSRLADASLDLRLLRALAVGYLVLRNISFKRVSSMDSSLKAIAIAHYFGANDFGYGAVDAATRVALCLQPIEAIREVARIAIEGI